MSSVIKLEYSVSAPVYTAVKGLILKTVLDWMLPERVSGGENGAGDVWVTSPVPSPSPMAGMGSFIPEGKILMREMWYSLQDNVNLLLEVCRQGAQTPPTPENTDLMRVIDLYFAWIKVSPRGCIRLIGNFTY